jgi:phosphopantothenoylcysteine decarboxylase/phosphopantothenate--cysteine ligase
MKVLVIAGPTSTPLDSAREISNRSTGRTGLIVADILRQSGLSPHLWLGVNLTHPIPSQIPVDARFRTIHDLQKMIKETPVDDFEAILLPAALPDYDFLEATGPDQRPLSIQKWPGSLSQIYLKLKPSPRILPTLRSQAPRAKLVGWKWEAATTLEQAEESARRQCVECQTNASVLNGPSYGSGYLFLPVNAPRIPCPDADALGRALASFLKS